MGLLSRNGYAWEIDGARVRGVHGGAVWIVDGEWERGRLWIVYVLHRWYKMICASAVSNS